VGLEFLLVYRRQETIEINQTQLHLGASRMITRLISPCGMIFEQRNELAHDLVPYWLIPNFDGQPVTQEAGPLSAGE